MNAEPQDDDYLWSAEAPATADIAALEHTLGSLRWQRH